MLKCVFIGMLTCMHRQSFEPTISDLDFVLQKKRFIPDAVSQHWL